MTPQMEGIIENFQKEMTDGDTHGPFDNVEDFLSSLKS
jgi:hypothetical protein